MTKEYYKEHLDDFIADTQDADMTTQYSFFLKRMPKEGLILDLGFGSGRDSIYFQSLGYEIYAIDPVEEFCELAKKKGISHVEVGTALEMKYERKFDGIWACASLLHVPGYELNRVFKKCSFALKENGIFYISFKYGSFEGIRNGRYFLDLNEDSIRKYLMDSGLEMVDIMITMDVREGNTTKWFNAILKKTGEPKDVEAPTEVIKNRDYYYTLAQSIVHNGIKDMAEAEEVLENLKGMDYLDSRSLGYKITYMIDEIHRKEYENSHGFQKEQRKEIFMIQKDALYELEQVYEAYDFSYYRYKDGLKLKRYYRNGITGIKRAVNPTEIPGIVEEAKSLMTSVPKSDEPVVEEEKRPRLNSYVLVCLFIIAFVLLVYLLDLIIN